RADPASFAATQRSIIRLTERWPVISRPCMDLTTTSAAHSGERHCPSSLRPRRYPSSLVHRTDRRLSACITSLRVRCLGDGTFFASCVCSVSETQDFLFWIPTVQSPGQCGDH